MGTNYFPSGAHLRLSKCCLGNPGCILSVRRVFSSYGAGPSPPIVHFFKSLSLEDDLVTWVKNTKQKSGKLGHSPLRQLAKVIASVDFNFRNPLGSQCSAKEIFKNWISFDRWKNNYLPSIAQTSHIRICTAYPKVAEKVRLHLFCEKSHLSKSYF